MNDNERLALAAHLHVAMRRKIGRVTDTEWMASNVAYGLAMVDIALAHANDHLDQDLGRLALRFGAALTVRQSSERQPRADLGATRTNLRDAPSTQPPAFRDTRQRDSQLPPHTSYPPDTRHPPEEPSTLPPPSVWPSEQGAHHAALLPLRRGRYVGGLR